jgi:hypothetical protein
MPEFSIRQLEADGERGPKQEFKAADVGEAVRYALSKVDGHSIELWGPDGLIGTFKASHRGWPPR